MYIPIMQTENQIIKISSSFFPASGLNTNKKPGGEHIGTNLEGFLSGAVNHQNCSSETWKRWDTFHMNKLLEKAPRENGQSCHKDMPWN